MSARNPTPQDDESKGKDIPSILPLAPGGVYAVKWETRMKRAEKLAITPLPDYRNPFGKENAENPIAFFDIVAGGYYLGRVEVEVKRDLCPITAENFLKLVEYKCYAGTKFKVYPGNWLVGGDISDLDEVVWDANDPEFFNYPELLPEVRAGGQSIYEDALFKDENFVLKHDGPGVLTMYNDDEPDANGSRFMITFDTKNKELDGKHVAFGQVVSGFDLLYSLQKLGDARQEGDTFQRVTIEKCGIKSTGSNAVAAMAQQQQQQQQQQQRQQGVTTAARAMSRKANGRKHALRRTRFVPPPFIRACSLASSSSVMRMF
jgi:cyclophilin family peptidyl-prolyl cis-trans isomerase